MSPLRNKCVGKSLPGLVFFGKGLFCFETQATAPREGRNRDELNNHRSHCCCLQETNLLRDDACQAHVEI